MVQGLGAVPASKDVHQRLVDYGRVPKSNVRLADKGNVVQHGCGRLLLVAQHNSVHFVAVRVRVVQDLPPAIGLDAVLVNVLEDLHLISPSVDIESVLVPHERVVGPGFRDLVRSLLANALLHATYCLGTAFELVPLLLSDFVLEQIVEVGASLARVAAKEVQTVSVRDGTST